LVVSYEATKETNSAQGRVLDGAQLKKEVAHINK
jgi:hypothetical protein